MAASVGLGKGGDGSGGGGGDGSQPSLVGDWDGRVVLPSKMYRDPKGQVVVNAYMATCGHIFDRKTVEEIGEGPYTCGRHGEEVVVLKGNSFSPLPAFDQNVQVIMGLMKNIMFGAVKLTEQADELAELKRELDAKKAEQAAMAPEWRRLQAAVAEAEKIK